MTLSFKHIGLLIGILSIFVSFLFAARQHEAYQILLLGGLVTASVFYLAILFGKERVKSKLFWTVIVVLGAALQQITESFLVDTSHRYYISQHRTTLAEVNTILQRKRGNVFVMKDSVFVESDTVTLSETEMLKKGKNELGVYMISKTDSKIYYGLWGFLDVRLGITYLPTKNSVGDKYRHVTGNWFR